MNHYRQSIILFGFALPLIIAAITVGGVGYLRAKVNTSYQNKSKHYASYQTNRRRALAIETQVGIERPHVSNWTEVLRTESTLR